MTFTVGYEKGYDQFLADPATSDGFCKLAGGYALGSPREAARIIHEMDKQGDWAVYQVEADWKGDTRPSPDGWWHVLRRDVRILRKVPTPSLTPPYPAHWHGDEFPTMNIRFVVPVEERQAVINWICDREGAISRTGPAGEGKLEVAGWVPLRKFSHPQGLNDVATASCATILSNHEEPCI